jgi:hypothetical protein
VNREEFLGELRTEVLAADERHLAPSAPVRSRRPHRGRWLGAAAVLLLVAGAAVALRPAPAAAGVEVIADADGLTIRLTDLTTRPEEVEAAAHDAGLDVTVISEPVGPSRVGRFIGLTGTGGTSEIVVTEGDAVNGFTAIRLPRGFDDSLELQIGREALPGEEWSESSDATAPGEPLECADLLGEPLSVGLEAADRAGVATVKVNLMDEGRWLAEDEFPVYFDASIQWASSASEDEVRLFVTERPRKTAIQPGDGC